MPHPARRSFSPILPRTAALAASVALLIQFAGIPAWGQTDSPAPPDDNPAAPASPAPTSPAPAPAPAAPSAPASDANIVAELANAPIAPGDTLRIMVLDQPEISGSFPVGSDGKVSVPIVGQVKLAGQKSTEAAATFRKTLVEKRLLKNPQVSIYITARPQRTVYVSGALQTQGQRAISLLNPTRLSDVLEPSGLLPTADLTKVVITRGDQKMQVDYFKYRNGQSTDPANNPVLENNDNIYVYATVVQQGAVRISGAVKEPRQVTLTAGTTVGQLIELSGGPTGVADRDNIFIQRGSQRIPVNYRDITAKKPGADIALQDKDVVNVPGLERPKEYTVTGAVHAPSNYPLQAPTTLLDAIAQARGTTDGARTRDIEVRHTQPNGTVQTAKYDLNDSKAASTAIEPGDYIFVPYPKRRREVDLFTILGATSSLWFLFRRR